MEEIRLEHIERRLAKEAENLALHQRRATASRKRRDTLVMKLLWAGYTERAVAPLCRISNAAVHQLALRWRRARERAVESEKAHAERVLGGPGVAESLTDGLDDFNQWRESLDDDPCGGSGEAGELIDSTADPEGAARQANPAVARDIRDRQQSIADKRRRAHGDGPRRIG